MKSILLGVSITTIFALVAVAAVAEPRAGARVAEGEAGGPVIDSAPSASPRVDGTAAGGEAAPSAELNGRPDGRCGPGPAWVTDMQRTPEGFLRYDRSDDRRFHEFYFTRAIYADDGRRRGGSYLGDGGPAWSIDYPDADRTMMVVAQRLSSLDACEWENPMSLADPELRRFPFLYSLEWGWADLTDAEVRGLREYLLAGGLLMLDDFWGTWEWQNFEEQMRRVLPGHYIEEVPRDHLLFRSYYHIEGEIIQVPMVANGRAIGMGNPNARTWEQDGYQAHVRGIFDDAGRLMVVINWNTDLGDALEWAEDPYYPLHFSRFASELFMNTIIYSMTQ